MTSSWNGYGGSGFPAMLPNLFFLNGDEWTRLQLNCREVSEAAEAVGCGAQEVAEAIRAVEATPVTRSEAEAVHSTRNRPKQLSWSQPRTRQSHHHLSFRHYGLAPQQRPRCLVSSRREWHGSVGNRKSCHRIRCNADRRPTWRSGKALLFEGSGSNDYLQAPFNQALSSSAISYSVWAKPTSTTNNHGSPITFRGNGRGFNLYKMPDNTWSYWTGNGGWQKFNSQPVNLNWTALAFTHDGTTGKATKTEFWLSPRTSSILPPRPDH